MGLKYNWEINIVNDSIEISDPSNSILYVFPPNSLIIQKLTPSIIRLKTLNDNIFINMNYDDIVSPASSDIDDLFTQLESTLYTGGGLSVLPAIGCSIDGLGSVIVADQVGFTSIIYSGTITSWTIIGDVDGEVVFNILKNGVSIIGGGNKPSVVSDEFTYSSATGVPTGWTSTTLTEGDIIEYVIESSSSFKKLNLLLKIV